MLVKGTKTTTEQVNIEVSPAEVFETLANMVLRSLHPKLHSKCFIDDKDRISESVEYHTSHSWYEDEVVIAEPTAEQREVLKALRLIRSCLYNYKEIR